jgi:hypothetical protein
VFKRAAAHGGLPRRVERPHGGSDGRHIRFHVLTPRNGKNSPQAEAAEELIDVVRAYLK